MWPGTSGSGGCVLTPVSSWGPPGSPTLSQTGRRGSGGSATPSYDTACAGSAGTWGRLRISICPKGLYSTLKGQCTNRDRNLTGTSKHAILTHLCMVWIIQNKLLYAYLIRPGHTRFNYSYFCVLGGYLPKSLTDPNNYFSIWLFTSMIIHFESIWHI